MAPKPAGQLDQGTLLGKRKQPPSSSSSTSRKRRNMSDFRKLDVQSHDEAFSNRQLNVADFVKARQFEIAALENGIKSSSRALSSRAFQEVPRDLRRRTASHNVKRVPKRLQARAKKEMQDDNTPTRKNKRILPQQRMRIETIKRMQAMTKRLKEKKTKKQGKKDDKEEDGEIIVTIDDGNDTKIADAGPSTTSVKIRKPRGKTSVLSLPPVPPARFRKRQMEKTWLPTHVFHAKRAHMSSPNDPLWRFALPLTPTEKSYRKTHRATTLRSAIAWDTSYMSTVALHGPEKGLVGLLKAVGVGSADEDKAIWGLKGAKWRRGTRTWNGWLYKRETYPNQAICPANILWNPEISASISVSSTEDAMEIDDDVTKPPKRSLLVRCHPSAFLELWEQVKQLAKVQKPSVVVEDLRYEVGSIEITGPNATEALLGTLRPFESPNADLESSTKLMSKVWKLLQGIQNANNLPKNILLSLDISDPRLNHPPSKDIKQKMLSTETDEKLLQICTQWPLDKEAAPMRLFDSASRSKASKALPTQKSVNHRKSEARPGQYPDHKKEDPKIPLVLFNSDCGNANQGSWTLLLPWKCVLAAWYPLMYFPISTGGTARFGGVEELRQIAYESGRPWFPADYPGTKAGQDWEMRARTKAKKEWDRKPKGRRTEFESIDLGGGRKGEIGLGWACDWETLAGDSWPLGQFPASVARKMTKDPSIGAIEAKDGPVVVKVTMLTRGVPLTRARIYRLPHANEALRTKWLSLLYAQRSKSKGKLLPQPGDETWPIVPDKDDLVGFITTGNFSLAEGKGIGIGSILLSKVMVTSMADDATETVAYQNLCIIRDAGERFGRLAKWDLVE